MTHVIILTRYSTKCMNICRMELKTETNERSLQNSNWKVLNKRYPDQTDFTVIAVLEARDKKVPNINMINIAKSVNNENTQLFSFFQMFITVTALHFLSFPKILKFLLINVRVLVMVRSYLDSSLICQTPRLIIPSSTYHTFNKEGCVVPPPWKQ